MFMGSYDSLFNGLLSQAETSLHKLVAAMLLGHFSTINGNRDCVRNQVVIMKNDANGHLKTYLEGICNQRWTWVIPRKNHEQWNFDAVFHIFSPPLEYFALRLIGYLLLKSKYQNFQFARIMHFNGLIIPFQPSWVELQLIWLV